MGASTLLVLLFLAEEHCSCFYLLLLFFYHYYQTSFLCSYRNKWHAMYAGAMAFKFNDILSVSDRYVVVQCQYLRHYIFLLLNFKVG